MEGRGPKQVFGIPNIDELPLLTSCGVLFDVSNVQEAFDELVLEEQLDLYDHLVGQPPQPLKNALFGGYDGAPFSSMLDGTQPLDDEGLIRKAVIAEGDGESVSPTSNVTVTYACYLQGSTEPIACSDRAKPETFDLEDSGLLPGMHRAIESMKVGEKSKFIVDYRLMYGELGCEPHIPKKAMCLLHIAVLSLNEQSSSDYLQSKRWPDVFKKVKVLFIEGCRMSKDNNFSKAKVSFEKANELLKSCCLADWKEEKLQIDCLCRVYKKLAFCYDRMNLPKKVCIIWNELNKISNAKKDVQMVRMHATALQKLGQFNRAEHILNNALKFAKNDLGLQKDLKLLQDKRSIIKNIVDITEQTTVKNIAEDCTENDIKVHETYHETETINSQDICVSEGFINEIHSVCQKFLNDTSLNTYTYKIPPGLVDDELNAIELIFIAYDLQIEEKTEKFIVIKKTIIPS